MMKKALRALIIEQRSRLSLSFQKTASASILKKLTTLPVIESAKTIALYSGTHGEVSPLLIVNHLHHKTWLLPIIHHNNQNKNHMEFAVYDKDTPLIKNKYGILEPSKEIKENKIDPRHIDVILLPLVAFDLEGHRIGYGGGYYDRALHFMQHLRADKPCLIGLAYEFQKIPRIISDPWDIHLDLVVTEENVYHTNKRNDLLFFKNQ